MFLAALSSLLANKANLYRFSWLLIPWLVLKGIGKTLSGLAASLIALDPVQTPFVFRWHMGPSSNVMIFKTLLHGVGSASCELGVWDLEKQLAFLLL